MRKLSLMCICLCLISVLFFGACSSKDSTADGAYVPIKDDNGTVTGYERKYHNENGDITRWDVYDAQEQYDHFVLYEYNSNNLLSKETYYQADGIGVYYYAYSYNEEGTIAEKDYVSAKEGSERILYDSEGKEKERYTYDIDDNLIKYEVFENEAWTEAELPTTPTEAEE